MSPGVRNASPTGYTPSPLDMQTHHADVSRKWYEDTRSWAGDRNHSGGIRIP